MKITKFFTVILILIGTQLSCFAQDFSFGWANLGTHFINNKENYNHSTGDFLSPGIELQFNYHITSNWSVLSGINYQSLFFNTPLKKGEINPPSQIKSVLLKDLSIPLLLSYRFAENKAYYWGLTIGIYYAMPQFAQYTEENKIYGGGGYDPSSITYTISDNYCYVYLGVGIHKAISAVFELYAEPFGCYQLNENLSSQKVRNQFWYGIKVGIDYSFKKTKE